MLCQFFSVTYRYISFFLCQICVIIIIFIIYFNRCKYKFFRVSGICLGIIRCLCSIFRRIHRCRCSTFGLRGLFIWRMCFFVVLRCRHRWLWRMRIWIRLYPVRLAAVFVRRFLRYGIKTRVYNVRIGSSGVVLPWLWIFFPGIRMKCDGSIKYIFGCALPLTSGKCHKNGTSK